MTQEITKIFHLIQTNPGVGEGSQLSRNSNQSGSQPSGTGGASGRGGGHLVGTWRRLPDISTRLTPIHLVGKETD